MRPSLRVTGRDHSIVNTERAPENPSCVLRSWRRSARERPRCDGASGVIGDARAGRQRQIGTVPSSPQMRRCQPPRHRICRANCSNVRSIGSVDPGNLVAMNRASAPIGRPSSPSECSWGLASQKLLNSCATFCASQHLRGSSTEGSSVGGALRNELEMVDRNSRPGDAGALKPRGREAVPREWLAEFAGDEDSLRLQELQADRDLLDRIMWAGYAGSEWEKLKCRLIGYGFAVVSAWIRSGVIFDRCRDSGVLLRRVGKCREWSEAQSLAGETVAMAVVKFRSTVLIPRVWRPEGGASLETFFVRQCLIRFSNIYRRWLGENGYGSTDALGNVQDRPPAYDQDWDRVASAGRYGQPGAEDERRAYVQLGSDESTQSILELVADDFTYPEIAQITGTNISIIKSRLYRLRQQRRKSELGDQDAV